MMTDEDKFITKSQIEEMMDEDLQWVITACMKEKEKRRVRKGEKEIEQLKKEKGWLKYKVLEASQKQYPELSLAEKVVMLEDDMKQALKEK